MEVKLNQLRKRQHQNLRPNHQLIKLRNPIKPRSLKALLKMIMSQLQLKLNRMRRFPRHLLKPLMLSTLKVN